MTRQRVAPQKNNGFSSRGKGHGHGLGRPDPRTVGRKRSVPDVRPNQSLLAKCHKELFPATDPQEILRFFPVGPQRCAGWTASRVDRQEGGQPGGWTARWLDRRGPAVEKVGRDLCRQMSTHCFAP